MVRIVNGMKAEEHLWETIECPICGEKLMSIERHWCGAKNNNYEKCKLRKAKLNDNNGFGFRFINKNSKTGEYTTTFVGSFENFLRRMKK